MSAVNKKLALAYHEFGELYCEACETHIDLSTASDFEEAREIAITHHQENHD